MVKASFFFFLRVGQAISYWRILPFCRIETVPVIGKHFKMSYLEQRTNTQPTAKLKKHAGKSFDTLQYIYSDKEKSRKKLFNRCNKFRGSKINVMMDEEII